MLWSSNFHYKKLRIDKKRRSFRESKFRRTWEINKLNAKTQNVTIAPQKASN